MFTFSPSMLIISTWLDFDILESEAESARQLSRVFSGEELTLHWIADALTTYNMTIDQWSGRDQKVWSFQFKIYIFLQCHRHQVRFWYLRICQTAFSSFFRRGAALSLNCRRRVRRCSVNWQSTDGLPTQYHTRSYHSMLNYIVQCHTLSHHPQHTVCTYT